ncbi:MAG: GntR family transcriptional regulator [Bacillota bacterium]|nr:GntR family transcriptional regulator [Bacillota bacterium]
MIRIDLKSDTPIYTQLRNQIILAIAKGEVQPGDPMPTVRQLAEDLGVNPMTVNKAYGELKQLGHLETNIRQGATVRSEFVQRGDYWNETKPQLELLIAESILNGITQAQFESVVHELYRKFQEVSR